MIISLFVVRGEIISLANSVHQDGRLGHRVRERWLALFCKRQLTTLTPPHSGSSRMSSATCSSDRANGSRGSVRDLDSSLTATRKKEPTPIMWRVYKRMYCLSPG